MTQKDAPNLYEDAVQHFEQAADRLGLDENLRGVLRRPRRQLVVSVPTLLDDGSVRVFEGYRVHHSTTRGPATGGIRFHPRFGLDDAKALAMSATWTGALLGIPLGGAHGGVTCDASGLSRGEVERLTRRYAAEIAGFLGPDRDVATPDLGTDAQVLCWILDTYQALNGRSSSAVVTGKPAELAGSVGRGVALARGAAVCIREACQTLRKPVRGATVAVQGFGALGAAVARRLHDDGAKVVSVGDTRGGAHSSRGLDPVRVAEHKRASGSVVGFRGAERITQEELLATRCDILVLAAMDGQIFPKNAHLVRCRVLAEIAGGAVSAAADRVLADRGVLVVPDLLCAAGGVTGSYFEWAQNLQGLFWDEVEVAKQIERFLRRAFHEVYEAARSSKQDLRSAAHVLGVGRVAEATRMRGLFP